MTGDVTLFEPSFSDGSGATALAPSPTQAPWKESWGGTAGECFVGDRPPRVDGSPSVRLVPEGVCSCGGPGVASVSTGGAGGGTFLVPTEGGGGGAVVAAAVVVGLETKMDL